MIKTIASIKSLNSSVNGNPRYEFGFEDGTTAISQSDTSYCYAIGNPGYRVGSTVEVTFTRAGRVSEMEPASSALVPDDQLTKNDKIVIYQLEKIDQCGDITEQFEEMTYAVAERLTDEGMTAEIVCDEDDPDYEAHAGDIRVAPGRFIALTFSATVVQEAV